MSNIDQLSAAVTNLTAAVADVKAGIAALKSELSNGGGDDPRIADAIAKLNGMHDALEAAVAPSTGGGATGPAPPVGTLPAGCVAANVPGAPGLVHLTGPFVSQHYESLAYAIDEVGASYPAGSPEQNFVHANVGQANGLQITQGDLAFPPACYPLVNGTLDTTAPIAGTLSAPSQDRFGKEKYRTVAEAQAWFGALK